MSHLRISPDGKKVAFYDHPERCENAGRLVIVDARYEGEDRRADDWGNLPGLVWAPAPATSSGPPRLPHLHPANLPTPDGRARTRKLSVAVPRSPEDILRPRRQPPASPGDTTGGERSRPVLAPG